MRKIKFCYLKNPNPTRENVISFIQDFPKELDLKDYVDYEMQFNKAFLEPVKTILDAIGWSVEKKLVWRVFFINYTVLWAKQKTRRQSGTKRIRKWNQANWFANYLKKSYNWVICVESKTLRSIEWNLPINDKELATIVSAMRLGGDADCTKN